MPTLTPEPTPNDRPSTNLTLEQQFAVLNYTSLFERGSTEQKTSLYKLLLESYYSQKNYYEALVKHQWLGNIDVVNLGTTEEERGGEAT